jgi:hypothetical protein
VPARSPAWPRKLRRRESHRKDPTRWTLYRSRASRSRREATQLLPEPEPVRRVLTFLVLQLRGDETGLHRNDPSKHPRRNLVTPEPVQQGRWLTIPEI